jgi:hypothetical protein
MTHLRAALFLLGGATATAAHGQDLSMFNAYNTMGINIANTVGLNAAANAQAQSVASGRSTDRLAAGGYDAGGPALSYTPDAAISRDVKARFTDAVVRADPGKEQHIRRVMATSNVLADFDRDMAPYGLSSNNTAEALTAYWITMWMIANEAPIPARPRVDAVRKQVAGNLKANAMFRKATPTQRQEMTEALVYEAMFALGQRASAGNNRARLNELAEQAQANVLKHGVNLQELRLTRSGFTR